MFRFFKKTNIIKPEDYSVKTDVVRSYFQHVSKYTPNPSLSLSKTPEGGLVLKTRDGELLAQSEATNNSTIELDLKSRGNYVRFIEACLNDLNAIELFAYTKKGHHEQYFLGSRKDVDNEAHSITRTKHSLSGYENEKASIKIGISFDTDASTIIKFTRYFSTGVSRGYLDVNPIQQGIEVFINTFGLSGKFKTVDQGTIKLSEDILDTDLPNDDHFIALKKEDNDFEGFGDLDHRAHSAKERGNVLQKAYGRLQRQFYGQLISYRALKKQFERDLFIAKLDQKIGIEPTNPEDLKAIERVAFIRNRINDIDHDFSQSQYEAFQADPNDWLMVFDNSDNNSLNHFLRLNAILLYIADNGELLDINAKIKSKFRDLSQIDSRIEKSRRNREERRADSSAKAQTLDVLIEKVPVQETRKIQEALRLSAFQKTDFKYKIDRIRTTGDGISVFFNSAADANKARDHFIKHPRTVNGRWGDQSTELFDDYNSNIEVNNRSITIEGEAYRDFARLVKRHYLSDTYKPDLATRKLFTDNDKSDELFTLYLSNIHHDFEP